jgi:hypothetical protein
LQYLKYTLFYTLLLKTVCTCAHYTLLKKLTFCFLSTNQLYAVHFDILNNELDNMIESDMYWYNAVPEQIHRYNQVQVQQMFPFPLFNQLNGE